MTQLCPGKNLCVLDLDRNHPFKIQFVLIYYYYFLSSTFLKLSF